MCLGAQSEIPAGQAPVRKKCLQCNIMARGGCCSVLQCCPHLSEIILSSAVSLEQKCGLQRVGLSHSEQSLQCFWLAVAFHFKSASSTYAACKPI